MIKHIYVSNYALIRELRLDLKSGMSTITGETGAGKSILLGALGLVLGNRADVKSLADESNKCVVEAHFNIAGLNLHDFFAQNDLDYEVDCIMRREILPSGKSRAFINDTPVLLDVLKELGERLVDIHSQHDSILLMNPVFQMELIDNLAQNQAEKNAYKASFQQWTKLLKQREELEKGLSDQQDFEYLSFLAMELSEAKLKANEEQELEEELNLLKHADDIQKAMAAALVELNDEFAALDRLHNASRNLETVAGYLHDAEVLKERLISAEIEIKDIATELHAKLLSVNTDDHRLQQVEDRLNLINNLLQKHKMPNTEQLIQHQFKLQQKLDFAVNGQQELDRVNKEIALQYDELCKAGEILGKTRKNTAGLLEATAMSYLNRLQFKDARLQFEIGNLQSPVSSGINSIRLMFQANTGGRLLAIEKSASGGELSRIMLVLKAILAQTKSLPSIIFDEIDTGISGQTAQRVADILKEMGEKMQVIAITHLPQIAARSKYQYRVEKIVANGSTETRIYQLDQEERVEEIARILSGEHVTDSARTTARELLAV